MAKYKELMAAYYEWFLDPRDSGSWCSREAYSDIVAAAEDHGPSMSANLNDFPSVVGQSIGWELLQLMLNDTVIQLDESGCLVLGDETFSVTEEGRVSKFRRSKEGRTDQVPALYKIRRVRQGGLEISELKPHPLLAKVLFHRLYF